MQDQPNPKVLRRIGRIVGTLCVIGVAGGAVIFGSDFLANRAAAAPAGDVAAAIPVAVKPVTFDDHYTVTRQFLGQVEAGTDAALSFELGGRLAEIAVDEGDVVQAGDVIARLDTGLLDAERRRLGASRDATSAQLAFAQTRLTRATDLRADGFSSQETLDQAQATRDELVSRIAEVDALIMSNAINIEKSVITAPFGGRVAAREAEATETLGAGQTVVTLVETSAVTVRVGLPLGVSTTDLSDVMIGIEGAQYPAVLHRLRPDVDPLTRTRTALFEISGDVAATFGQTATLLITENVATRGAWLPLDALQQGSGSIWTVLVVEDSIVRTAAIEVLHTQSDRAFVRGTFQDGAQIIATGAHRVVPGQRVTVSDAQG